MENPNWSMVELEGPSEDDFLLTAESSGSVRARDKSYRGKNAKQLTWVLLLKAHRAAGCLTSIGSAMFGVAAAIRRRVASGRTDSDVADHDDEMDAARAAGVGREKENPTIKTTFYLCIKMFLWLSVLLLGFEVVAFYKGWHLGTPHFEFQLRSLWATPLGVKGMFDWIYSRWVFVRVEYLAPPLQFLANACIVLFLIQSLDRLILCLGCFWIRFKKIKPVPKQGYPSKDLESGEDNGDFPMVLVQIPMCNEKEVNKTLKLKIPTLVPPILIVKHHLKISLLFLASSRYLFK